MSHRRQHYMHSGLRELPDAGIHGGPTGSKSDHLIMADFSVSLNAYGPAECVTEAIRCADIHQYPDPTSLAARAAAASRWKIAIDEVMFGAGASELLYAATQYLTPKNGTALIATPTFGDYERASLIAGANIVRSQLFDPDVKSVTTAEIIKAIETHRPGITFICTPNNPTGHSLTSSQLTDIAIACKRIKGFIIIDQSYTAFTDTDDGLPTPALRGVPNVLHLRSITKDHALAGIRAGYLTGPSELLHEIEKIRAPWAASSIAQSAAVAAMSDEGHAYAVRTIRLLRTAARDLYQSLTDLGYRVKAGNTHTLLIEVGDAAHCSAWLTEMHHIRVRDCTSFGLSQFIRVAARKPEENTLLVSALHDYLKSGEML